MAGGKFTPILSKPVTLNLFQGPFLGADRSAVRQQGRAGWPLSAATGLAAPWTLKQVQGDDICEVVL
jgi:hypothetical protein